MIRRAAPLALVLLGLLACEGSATVQGQPLPPGQTGSIALVSLAPTVWVPGTAVQLRAEAFEPGDVASLRLSGTVGGGALEVLFPVDIADARTASLRPDQTLLDAGEGRFAGDARLLVRRGGRELQGALEVSLDLAGHLQPRIASFPEAAAFHGDEVEVRGGGFLLPGEGEVALVFEGSFKTPGARFPTIVPQRRAVGRALDRERLVVPLLPSVFGFSPGEFSGRVAVENVHDWDGTGFLSEWHEASLTIEAPTVSSVDPPAAARGQFLYFRGAGFVEEPGVTTLVRLDGSFAPRRGKKERWEAREILGRAQTGALQVTLAPRGQLELFGGTPGHFQGTARVVVAGPDVELVGPPTPIDFTIAPTRQMVYLKFLPGFTESLRGFGLRNVEREVKDRILEVCRRDYAEFAVEFTDTRPDADWAEYSVLELNGEDPNGAGLFGLDNTEGKDDGNERLDDVIGGRNAETEETGSYAFGGVFLDSFLALSPSAQPANELADPRFDALFGPFQEQPVSVGEYPTGRRAREIGAAIVALGNLVGGTVVHEIGHSLGLAQVPGDPAAFHDPGDEPGLIMNPGGARSFAERAELDGLRAEWSAYDRAYLLEILPRE